VRKRRGKRATRHTTHTGKEASQRVIPSRLNSLPNERALSQPAHLKHILWYTVGQQKNRVSADLTRVAFG
jgi:hypothetical protein